MQDFSRLIVEQGESINQIESHTEVAAENTLKADEELSVAVKEVKKGRRAGLGALIDGGTGGALGMIGFAVNPADGLATLLIGGALGGGVGGLLGMTSSN